jgi:NADH:ubiquinone oxidoreductase subunit K
MTLTPFDLGIVAVVALIGIGLYGLMVLRNLVKMIIALQSAAKGAVLALILAGIASNQLNLAQSLAATVILVDTLVAVIGLALAVQLHRTYGTIDLKMLVSRREQPLERPG